MNVSGLLVLVAATCAPNGLQIQTTFGERPLTAVAEPRVISTAEPRLLGGAVDATPRYVRAAGIGAVVQASSQTATNADAATLRDFQERINRYGEMHKAAAKGTAKPKESADPAKIITAQDTLAARIRDARPTAKQGDMFTPETQRIFRRLLAPPLKGEDGRDAKALIKDDAPAPGSIPFKVNAKYPEGAPVPTVPASVLLGLPTLPRPLEYRIIGRHLLLLDTEAGIIVDYIPNAIP
jgi:hypothetical protein